MKSKRDEVRLLPLYEPGPSFSEAQRHTQSEPGQFAAASASAWALIPSEEPPRFEAVSGRYSVERVMKPRPLNPWHRPMLTDLGGETVVLPGHRYRLRSFAWEGVIYAVDEDFGRLAMLLRGAEGVILFVAWLRAEHEKRKPIRCRCGELRQVGAKGWRYGTCEDGEPRWRCPECVKQDCEPEAR